MVRKKKYKRNKTKFWALWSLLFVIILIVGIVGNAIAGNYAPIINSTLNVSTTEVSGLSDESSSSYAFTAEGEAELEADNIALVNQVMEEGAVLVKNNNDALPLKSGDSVSIFGNAQYKYLDMSTAFGNDGVTVNTALYDRYQSLSERYANITGTSVNDVPWSEISDVAGSGTAAIAVFGRDAGEGADCSSAEGADYLALSTEETELLQQLTNLKSSGTFEKLIVVLATSNSIDSEYLVDGNDLGIDVDAVVWVAMPAKNSYTDETTQTLVDLMCSTEGQDFSGRLVDTMYVDNQLLPEMQNVITNADTSQADSELIKEVAEDQSKWAGAQGNFWRTTITYAEGIYHSYKYYETRYEDYILNGDAHGAYNGWSYDSYVAAPFATGLHYNTDISYTGMTVQENDADATFDVTVTVHNGGSTDVKESVLIYMQTPYTERDASLGIEESSIKLVGYEKETIPAGESVDVTVSVDQEEMASYDEYESKTYIRDEGTYYLTTGENVHDAMNNILAAKTADDAAAAGRMSELGESGNATLVWSAEYTFDDTIFSTSSITGAEITNQFEQGDLNKDEDAQAAGNSVTYLSRQDWVGTFPKEVVVKYNDAMVLKAKSQVYEAGDGGDAEMPKLGQNLGTNAVTFVDLIGLDYDDPQWDTFLSQLTIDELITNVSISTNTAIPEYLVPAARDVDGPTAVYVKMENGGNAVEATAEDLRAATYNKQLLEDVGRQLFGENLLHSNGDASIGWWGPGVNIHRTPYGGRNYSYYSEDSFVSGMSTAAETKGIKSVNGVAIAKHFILNDEEVNRHGVSVWANEQTIRENYLPSFKLGAEKGGLDSVMTSFNRLGMEWTGQSEPLLEGVLRDELGMKGMFITDMYETDYEDMADGIMGGNTRWLSTSENSNLRDPAYELVDADDAAFVSNLVDAVHHNLWNVVNSFAMDGYTSETVVTVLTPWWQIALYALIGVSAALSAACIAMTVRSVLRKRKQKAASQASEGVQENPEKEV